MSRKGSFAIKFCLWKFSYQSAIVLYLRCLMNCYSQKGLVAQGETAMGHRPSDAILLLAAPFVPSLLLHFPL